MSYRPSFLITAASILGVLFVLLAIMRFLAPALPGITPYVLVGGILLMLLAPTIVHAILLRRSIRRQRDDRDE